MGTTDEDKTELEHLGFTFTASMTPYSSPHYHMHVKGPTFQGDKGAIAFDVDDTLRRAAPPLRPRLGVLLEPTLNVISNMLLFLARQIKSFGGFFGSRLAYD